MIHSLWQISLRNIKANKSTMLTAFISVILSVTLIVLMVTFTHQAQNALIEEARQRMGGIDAIASGEITSEEIESILQIKGVSDVLPMHQWNLDVQADQDKDRQFNVFAVGIDNSPMARNRYEFTSDIGHQQVIISAAVADLLELGVGEEMKVAGKNFEIIEIIATKRDSKFYESPIVMITFADFSQILGTTNANYLEMAFDEPQMIPQLLPLIRQINENLTFSSIADDIEQYENFSILQIFIYTFAAIVIFACSYMVVSNFQIFIAIYRKQFAIMRSFGTSGHQLWEILLIQGFIIVGSGTICAILLSSILKLFIFPLLANFFSLTMIVTLNIKMLLFVAGLVSIFILGSLLIPANQCRRLLPIKITQGLDNHSEQWKWKVALGAVFEGLSLLVLIVAVFEIQDSNDIKRTLLMIAVLLYIPGFFLLFPWVLSSILKLIQSKLRKIMKGVSEITISNMINNLKTSKSMIFSIAFVFLVSTFGGFMIQTLSHSTLRYIENNMFLDIRITDILGQESQLNSHFIEELLLIEGIENAVVLSESEFFVLPSEAGDIFSALAYLSLDALGNLEEMNIDVQQPHNMALITSEFANLHNLNVGDDLILRQGDLLSGSVDDLPVSTERFTFPIGAIVDSFYFAPYVDIYIDWNNSLIPPNNFIFDRAFIQTNDQDKVMDALSELRNRYPEIRWATLEDEMALNEQMFLERYGMFMVVLFLVTITLCLGMINSIFSEINCRRKEFAVLRAIGTPKKQLGQTVYLQVFIYMIIGAVVGITHGILLTAIIAIADETFMSIDYILPSGTFIMLLVLLIPTIWKRTGSLLNENLLTEM